tara:strand:+ start:150 stop:623 length:474 start_codon:yes stop_codon:yes gene_type:complete
MNNKFIKFYNNLVKLTRNKILYKDFTNQDTFSDRLLIFLFHFAFFLNIFKSEARKETLQSVFDYIFNHLETSIREIGYGDASINKKMKTYINTFYSILSKVDKWEDFDLQSRKKIFKDYLNVKNESLILVDYFENYRNFLKKNSLNSLLKGVSKPNF